MAYQSVENMGGFENVRSTCVVLGKPRTTLVRLFYWQGDRHDIISEMVCCKKFISVIVTFK